METAAKRVLDLQGETAPTERVKITFGKTRSQKDKSVACLSQNNKK